MKKALIASTALVLSAGVAAAEVTISGYGRTGIIYYENQTDAAGNDLADTQVVGRVRFNIDGKTSTDAGVDFGARIRLQWDQGEATTERASPGYLYATASGLTVYVGNVPTAYDSAGLLYASELGAFDRSFGNTRGSFYAFSSKTYGAENNRVGVAAEYSVDALTVRMSYIDPDQSGLNEDGIGENEELGFSVDYTWNDALELSAAAVMDGNGFDGNDQYFLGARYAVMPNARVGLNWIDNGDVPVDPDGDGIFVGDGDAARGKTLTLYGDYTLADGVTNFEAYVANNNADENETDNAFGIGVNYDLGGARLGASIHRDFAENVTADFGVRFNF